MKRNTNAHCLSLTLVKDDFLNVSFLFGVIQENKCLSTGLELINIINSVLICALLKAVSLICNISYAVSIVNHNVRLTDCISALVVNCCFLKTRQGLERCSICY